jgi:hypothetical protein
VTVSRRFLLFVTSIAAMQGALAAGLFGMAGAVSDSGRPLPRWLSVAVSVLGMPGILLSDALQSRLGDRRSIYVGFALGGVVWGCAIGAITLYVRRRRTQ